MCTTVDINECEGYNDCHQICTNTNGSYYCSCDTGFVLLADNRTCQGYHCYSLACNVTASVVMCVIISIPASIIHVDPFFCIHLNTYSKCQLHYE